MKNLTKFIRQAISTGARIGFLNPAQDHFFEHWQQFFTECYNQYVPCFLITNYIFLDKYHQSDLLIVFEPSLDDLRKVNLLCSSKILVLYRDINYLAIFESFSKALYDGVEALEFFTTVSLDLDPIIKSYENESWLFPLTESALFLDRDDVTVINVAYNKNPEAVQLREGIIPLINRAHSLNHRVVLVSNQSGLARGLFDWSDCMKVHSRMCQLLAAGNAWFDDFYYAGYIDEGRIEREMLLPSLRKPRPGMFIEASRKLRIHTGQSIMVGDSCVDMIGGYYAGIRDLYLITTDKIDSQLQELLLFERKHTDFKFNLINDFKDVKISIPTN